MINTLIVDDEPSVRLSIRYLADFEKNGISNVFEASSSKEAKCIIKNNKIQLLFTDISMPEENGISLMQWVNENYPDMKIIAISGYQNFDYILQSMRNGVIDYILKPIDPQHLTGTIQKALSLIQTGEDCSDTAKNFNDLREYLDQNYDKPISLDSLSEKFGFNSSYISRKFKQIFGVGIIEYITGIKIKKAKEMMIFTDMKQIEIAMRLGFKDEKYFSRVFCKEEGISPALWRKKNR